MVYLWPHIILLFATMFQIVCYIAQVPWSKYNVHIMMTTTINGIEVSNPGFEMPRF
jgi:hypothetical protein